MREPREALPLSAGQRGFHWSFSKESGAHRMVPEIEARWPRLTWKPDFLPQDGASLRRLTFPAKVEHSGGTSAIVWGAAGARSLTHRGRARDKAEPWVMLRSNAYLEQEWWGEGTAPGRPSPAPSLPCSSLSPWRDPCLLFHVGTSWQDQGRSRQLATGESSSPAQRWPEAPSPPPSSRPHPRSHQVSCAPAWPPAPVCSPARLVPLCSLCPAQCLLRGKNWWT